MAAISTCKTGIERRRGGKGRPMYEARYCNNVPRGGAVDMSDAELLRPPPQAAIAAAASSHFDIVLRNGSRTTSAAMYFILPLTSLFRGCSRFEFITAPIG